MRRNYYVILPGLISLQRSEDEIKIPSLITASFFLSHDIRRDVNLYLVFASEKIAVKFTGEKIGHIHVDERSLLGVLKKIRKSLMQGKKAGSPHSGITLQKYDKIGSFLPSKAYLDSDYGTPIEALKKQILTQREISIIFRENIDLKLPRSFPRIKTASKGKRTSAKIAITNIVIDRWLERKIGIIT